MLRGARRPFEVQFSHPILSPASDVASRKQSDRSELLCPRFSPNTHTHTPFTHRSDHRQSRTVEECAPPLERAWPASQASPHLNNNNEPIVNHVNHQPTSLHEPVHHSLAILTRSGGTCKENPPPASFVLFILFAFFSKLVC